jgi:hypothetical protein
LLEAQWNSNDGPTFTKGIVFRTAGSPKEIFMLGDAILYAVRRAASTAIQNVERQAAWTAAAATFLMCALVTALIAAYQVLQPVTGVVGAVALIGIACGLIGLACLSLPGIVASENAQEAGTTMPVSAAVGAFNEEAREAGDYFGAARVVTTAFLFGLGAARKLRT